MATIYGTGYLWGTGWIWGGQPDGGMAVLLRVPRRRFTLKLLQRLFTLKVPKMSNSREVIEGPQFQGVDERITYALDISQWGSNPTAIACVIKQGATDVTATVATGTPTATSTTVITLPQIHSLTAELEYRVEVKFTVAGQVVEAYFIIEAEV